MSPGSPRTAVAGRLVYCEGVESVDLDKNPEGIIDELEGGKLEGKSMYVELFEEMQAVVLQSEAYLFTQRELTCIAKYSKLSYPARYLFVRLCLRKLDKWHRVGDLNYQKELGNEIVPAMRELCQSGKIVANISPPEAVVKTEVRDDVIDLTLDEDEDEDVKPNALKLEQSELDIKPSLGAIQNEPDYSVYAEDEAHASVRDLLECLKTEELRQIVKLTKVQKRENKRDALINVLLTSTSGQATLPFTILSSGKGKRPDHKKLKQTPLTHFMKPKTQQDRLRALVTQQLGACIKLNPDVVKLFRRVNMVYFRSTQYSSNLLTDAILARCKKRNHPTVPYNRNANLWGSREALLQYEAALEMESQIDTIWGATMGGASRSRSRSVASKTPVPARILRSEGTRSPDKRNRGEQGIEENVLVDEDDTPRMNDARYVKAIFSEAYPIWLDLVDTKGEEEPRDKGLERFHHGHVLTRVVCKGADALGILKEHEYELMLLEQLLAQLRWRRGRRGRWHERRALILMTHFPKTRETHERAHKAVIEALQDENTHIVYRPKLLRRLETLQNKLNIPANERVHCVGRLQKAEQTYITGTRIHQIVDGTGRFANADKNVANTSTKQGKLPFRAPNNATSSATTQPSTPTGKSIWVGRGEEKVFVEIFALQFYEEAGFKGFHCEGRIITTIFGLLFWDIIFAPIPGAFETMYQVAPLDIAEETFYTSRQELIETRLGEIREGRASELLQTVYDEHGPSKNGCVGVRWDLFERQNLVEIVECLGSAELAAICQVLAEDYGNRTSGVPDLVIWNINTSECKFVEVKGPGDTLQENQKTWIAVLLQAGVPVEVCHVSEEIRGEPKKSKTKTVAQTPTVSAKRKQREFDVVPSSEPEEADYSELDPTQEEEVPGPEAQLSAKSTFAAPRRRAVEVVITTPPRKKPKRNS